jgi:release factor glutamine methyltransferase
VSTRADLVRKIAERLGAAGVEDPRREAMRLVADGTGLTLGELLLRPEALADPDVEVWAWLAAARRAAGEPLAYVSGVAGFRQLTLAVDRRVLIPRPETEGLVQLVLDAVPGGTVADVGTGSGCIALSLALEGAYRLVVAIDRSSEALGVARANARRAGLPVALVQGDLLAPMGTQRFDAIVSNPPYLSGSEWERLDRSVRDWEPRLALESGADGLASTGRLLAEAGTRLVSGGMLALELDHSRAALVAAMARRTGWVDVAVTQDLFGRDRFLTARRGSQP